MPPWHKNIPVSHSLTEPSDGKKILTSPYQHQHQHHVQSADCDAGGDGCEFSLCLPFYVSWSQSVSIPPLCAVLILPFMVLFPKLWGTVVLEGITHLYPGYADLAQVACSQNGIEHPDISVIVPCLSYTLHAWCVFGSSARAIVFLPCLLSTTCAAKYRSATATPKGCVEDMKRINYIEHLNRAFDDQSDITLCN